MLPVYSSAPADLASAEESAEIEAIEGILVPFLRVPQLLYRGGTRQTTGSASGTRYLFVSDQAAYAASSNVAGIGSTNAFWRYESTDHPAVPGYEWHFLFRAIVISDQLGNFTYSFELHRATIASDVFGFAGTKDADVDITNHAADAVTIGEAEFEPPASDVVYVPSVVPSAVPNVSAVMQAEIWRYLEPTD